MLSAFPSLQMKPRSYQAKKPNQFTNVFLHLAKYSNPRLLPTASGICVIPKGQGASLCLWETCLLLHTPVLLPASAEALCPTTGELLALPPPAQRPLKIPAGPTVCLMAGLISAELGLHAGVQSPADGPAGASLLATAPTCSLFPKLHAHFHTSAFAHVIPSVWNAILF